MPKGLKFVLAILFIGLAVPLATMLLTLNNKPTYHTIQPEVTGCFAQFTWQEKPITNLEHLLLFIDKPDDYQVESGLDIFPCSNRYRESLWIAGTSVCPVSFLKRSMFFEVKICSRLNLVLFTKERNLFNCVL